MNFVIHSYLWKKRLMFMLAYICTAAAAAAALALNMIVFELVYVLRGAGQYF